MFTQSVYCNGMSCQGLVHVADMSSDGKKHFVCEGVQLQDSQQKIFLYIYIPRTQMTLVLIGKGLVLRG